MIPIKNAASGTAPVSHNQTEGTPNQDTYQITYIESNGNQEQPDFAYYSGKIQNADYGNQDAPKDKHFVGSFRGGYNIVAKGLVIDFLLNRLKPIGEQLLRSQRHFIFNGENLQDHVHNPYAPQKMEKRNTGKEVHSIEYFKTLGRNKTQKNAEKEDKNTADQTQYVPFSCGRHRILLSLMECWLEYWASPDIPKAPVGAICSED